MMNNINPSDWIVNQVELITKKNKINTIIDVACGFGRHSVYLANKNYKVVSIDIDFKKLRTFTNNKNISSACLNLENHEYWPIQSYFDIVIVVNYLYRRNFNNILNLVKKDGYLIYETFCIGNEKYGKPKRKEYLLENKELKNITDNRFVIKDFYQGIVSVPTKSFKQMLVAKRVAM